MTEEHPAQGKHVVRCRDCSECVHIESRDGALVVTCRCDGRERVIQQIAAMPSGWVA